MIGNRCDKVSAQHGNQYQSNYDGKNDGEADSVDAGREVGASVLNLVYGVKGILNSGDANRSGPYGCNEAKGQLARGGCGGGLVECLENGAKGRRGNDQREIT